MIQFEEHIFQMGYSTTNQISRLMLFWAGRIPKKVVKSKGILPWIAFLAFVYLIEFSREDVFHTSLRPFSAEGMESLQRDYAEAWPAPWTASVPPCDTPKIHKKTRVGQL